MWRSGNGEFDCDMDETWIDSGLWLDRTNCVYVDRWVVALLDYCVDLWIHGFENHRSLLSRGWEKREGCGGRIHPGPCRLQPMASTNFLGFPPRKSQKCPPPKSSTIGHVECGNLWHLVPWFFLSNTVTIQLENLVFLCLFWMGLVGRLVIKCGWKIPQQKWRVEWEKNQ